MLSKAAGSIGGNATFRCRATAVPPPRWAWRRDGDDAPLMQVLYHSETFHMHMSLQNTTRITIMARQLDPMTSETSLTINSVEREDYNYLYSCKAENSDGADSNLIRLSQLRMFALFAYLLVFFV